MRASGLVYSQETPMAKRNHEPKPAETGNQVPARPRQHSGSAANQTVDGLDATAEALRHAVRRHS